MNRIGKTKTISFAVGNLDVYDHIQEKSNGSQYICDAIRFYEKYKTVIEKQNLQSIDNFDSLIEEKVRDILLERSRKQPILKNNQMEGESVISNSTMRIIKNN